MTSPPHRFKPTPFESNHSAAENGDDNITVRRDRCARAFLHRAWSPACPTADQISFATHFFFLSPKSRCFFGNLLGHNSTRLHSTHFTFIIVNWRSHERLFSGFFSQLPPCNKEKKNENKHPENCWRLLCLFASMAQATNQGGLANSWWYETDDGNVYVTRDDASCVVQTLFSRKSANGCLCWVVGDKKKSISSPDCVVSLKASSIFPTFLSFVSIYRLSEKVFRWLPPSRALFSNFFLSIHQRQPRSRI